MGVTRMPSTANGGIDIVVEAPPGGSGIGGGGGGGGTIIGGGATFTGGGAHAATALITMMAARLLTPTRIKLSPETTLEVSKQDFAVDGKPCSANRIKKMAQRFPAGPYLLRLAEQGVT